MGQSELAPFKPVIPFSLLEQLDVRVGTIVAVEPLPKSDRLVRLGVDFGDRTRNVVVGMKQEREHPEEITGLQALFVVNLEPKKIHGILSEAVLFDIGYADGIRPVLAVPESPVPNGTRVG